MRIRIRDLKPNPFRDLGAYPVDEGKVIALVNSIHETGFWNNILVRRNVTEKNPRAETQIAYGHHRLLALHRVYGEDSVVIVDIPVKKLSDEIMLKVMVEENNTYYDKRTYVIDDGIRKVWEYLLNASPLGQKRDRYAHQVYFEGLPVPSGKYDREKNPEGFRYSVVAWQISNWLGRNWSERTIFHSLTRLQDEGRVELVKKGEDGEVKVEKIETPILSQEAVESLPNVKTSETFSDEVRRLNKNRMVKGRVSLEAQKKAARRCIAESDFSRDHVGSALLTEHLKDIGTMKEEEKKELTMAQRIESLMTKLERDMQRVGFKLEELINLKRSGAINERTFVNKWKKHKFSFSLIRMVRQLQVFYMEFVAVGDDIKKRLSGRDD